MTPYLGILSKNLTRVFGHSLYLFKVMYNFHVELILLYKEMSQLYLGFDLGHFYLGEPS